MYIKRAIENKIISLPEHFTAIAIIGPRQAGKTTHVKESRSDFVIPDCPELYKMADKCHVGNLFQVMESIK